eukprot:859095-Pyramimonas_sp.AAC.1
MTPSTEAPALSARSLFQIILGRLSISIPTLAELGGNVLILLHCWVAPSRDKTEEPVVVLTA